LTGWLSYRALRLGKQPLTNIDGCHFLLASAVCKLSIRQKEYAGHQMYRLILQHPQDGSW
jgi:hypothetical protein